MKRAALFALLLAGAAGAQDLQTCRALTDPAQRLACYDALPAPAAASPAPATPTPESVFGAGETPKVEEAKELRSHLVGAFDGWNGGAVFRLENGQRWKATGGDLTYFPGVPDNAAVTIRKSAFGAYWMQVEGLPPGIKVRRVD